MEWQGHAMTFAEGWKGVVAAGIAYTAIAWLTIFVFRLLFVAPFQLWKGGHWLDREFVYDAPVLAFHRKVAAIDNDKVHKFQFRDAPPFSLIRYTIEVAGREELIAVTVDAHPQQNAGMARHLREIGRRIGGGASRVNRKRDMCMRADMRADADPISVRVWVTSWTCEGALFSN
jgi:hypothetical protein